MVLFFQIIIMHWSKTSGAWTSLILLWGLILSPIVLAGDNDPNIGTRSLKPCMADSGITATLVDVRFFTNTSKLHFNINAYSSISGKVQVSLTAFAYGFNIFSLEFDPCEKEDWTQLCPMEPQPLTIESNLDFDKKTVDSIPGIS